jgi:hypothetical protein
MGKNDWGWVGGKKVKIVDGKAVLTDSENYQDDNIDNDMVKVRKIMGMGFDIGAKEYLDKGLDPEVAAWLATKD